MTFNPATPHPVIALITEWQDQKGTLESRDETSQLGGTMRLGAQEVRLSHGSRAHEIYGADVVSERHRGTATSSTATATFRSS